MKILNLYIPIPTPAIWLLPSKKKKHKKNCCRILPCVGFLSGITVKSGKGLDHTAHCFSDQLEASWGPAGSDSRPVAADAIALKSRF